MHRGGNRDTLERHCRETLSASTFTILDGFQPSEKQKDGNEVVLHSAPKELPIRPPAKKKTFPILRGGGLLLRALYCLRWMLCGFLAIPSLRSISPDTCENQGARLLLAKVSTDVDFKIFSTKKKPHISPFPDSPIYLVLYRFIKTAVVAWFSDLCFPTVPFPSPHFSSSQFVGGSGVVQILCPPPPPTARGTVPTRA